MTPPDVITIARDAIIVALKIGLPVLLVALIVGLAISLVQALTQVQEMTLSFVPKIVITFLSIILLLPFMMSTLITFTQQLADKMIGLP